MKIEDSIRPLILKQPVYLAGKPIEYVAREFGLDPDNILKMASNENPLGSSPKAIEAINSDLLNTLNYYPDGSHYDLSIKLAQKLGLDKEQIVCGNGSNEILETIAKVFLEEGKNSVFGTHSFIVYKIATQLVGAECKEVEMPNLRYDFDLLFNAIDENTRVVFLASPNNPTGTLTSQEELDSFIAKLPEGVILVLDCAYTEFQDEPLDIIKHIKAGKNVICTQTFSKIYGLAGLRVGYAYTTKEIAKYLEVARQPFNTNSIAQKAAIAAIDDADFVAKSKAVNDEGMKFLANFFEEMNLEYIAEGGNFVMVKLNNALEIFDSMQKLGIILRPNVGYGLPDWLRITIGKPEQNARLVQELRKLL
ncbi:MAG: histidinol-phosphate transaminase [Opitutales bacterium]